MDYHDKLKIKIDLYIKSVYQVTINFPREEIYGVTSQLRRAALSVMLNYVEGYARRRGENCKIYKNFLEIAYGSLRETKYILYLSVHLKYLSDSEYQELIKGADEIGAMIYKITK